MVFPVIFELAATGIRCTRRILKRNAGSEELVKKKGRERRMKERMFTLTMKLGRCVPSPPPNATDSCGRRKRKRRKWRGKKSGEKMLFPVMLGWMRENRKDGKWVGEVEYGHWTMMCNFSISYNLSILGGKTWEENGACGSPTFSLLFSFLSHFLYIQAR